MVGGIDASIHPSPERKVRKISHQEQIGKQNERNRNAIHAQAHGRAATLIAEERMKPKENRRTAAQVIAQVEGEFRTRGYGVTLSKNTINRYVALLGMLGTFPLVRGYEGMMPRLKNELGNDVGWLKSKELEVLLRWKGVIVSTMGNIANRRILYQQFAKGGAEEVGIVPAPWAEINEAELIALRDGLRNRKRGMWSERIRR